jgi:hypothetical protein
MAKENFSYRETESLFKKLEQLSQRSGVSRGQAFEDWLTAITCALAAETMEEEYMAMIERHKDGKPGKRGADLMAQMFAELVHAMGDDETSDILGDLFQSSISYNEAGQYLSPSPVAQLLSELTVDSDARSTKDQPLLFERPGLRNGTDVVGSIKDQFPRPGSWARHRCKMRQNCQRESISTRAIRLDHLRQHTHWREPLRLSPWFVLSRIIQCQRRGVIREVPVEKTPVLSISGEARDETKTLVDPSTESQSDTTNTQTLPTLPTIMEIPQWLARLEPALTNDNPIEPPPTETQAPSRQTESSTSRPKQQELF